LSWFHIYKNSRCPDRWLGYYQGNRDPDVYLSDGSYTRVSSFTYPGIVFWGRPGDHSAVANVQGNVTSKWNEWPLMVHAVNYSPFGSSNLEYYVKSSSIPTISGPAIVPCSSNAKYSITPTPGLTPSLVTWSVSSSLKIDSGQGSKDVYISKSNSSSISGTISAVVSYSNGACTTSTQTFYVSIPQLPPSITSVVASSYYTYVGSSVTVTASPYISPSQGYYDWVVSPSYGFSKSEFDNELSINFSLSGSYQVKVRTTSACGSTSYVPVTIVVN